MIFILGSKLNPIHKYFIAKIESKVQVFIFIFPQTRVALRKRETYFLQIMQKKWEKVCWKEWMKRFLYFDNNEKFVSMGLMGFHGINNSWTVAEVAAACKGSFEELWTAKG